MAEKTKPWFLSKVLIVNGLTLAGGLLATLAGSDLIAANPQVAAGIASAIAAVNIGLRFITSLPIEW